MDSETLFQSTDDDAYHCFAAQAITIIPTTP